MGSIQYTHKKTADFIARSAVFCLDQRHVVLQLFCSSVVQSLFVIEQFDGSELLAFEHFQ